MLDVHSEEELEYVFLSKTPLGIPSITDKQVELYHKYCSALMQSNPEFQTEFGYKGEILWDESKPDGTSRKLLDISRLKSIGWQSKINLEQGVRETISSFLNEINEGIIRY